MKLFDLHSDFPTKVKDFNDIIINSDTEIVGAVYSGKRTFSQAIEIAKKVKTISKNVHLGFENIGYEDCNFEEIIKLKPLYCSLTYNGENQFGYGCDFDLPLKSYGESVAKELSNANVFIDVAHLSIKGALQLTTLTNKVFCSHTALNSVYKHKRNLTDDVIVEIVSLGGVIGLTPVSYFISNSPTLFDYFIHVDYFIQKFGDKNLSIGTDFYGCDKFAGNLSSYEDFIKLKEIMLNHGYGEETVKNIFYKNAKNYFNR